MTSTLRFLIVSALLLVLPSDAFSAPVKLRQQQAGPSLRYTSSALCDGASDDIEGDSPSRKIIVALTTREEDDVTNTALRQALKDHPFQKMSGIELTIVDIPCVSSDSSENITWSDEDESIIERVDIADVACFVSPVAVASWLDNIDEELDVPDDISDDDRRKLPNGDVKAACACAETARVCLDTGRWISNEIYYPRGGIDSDIKNSEGASSVDLEEWATWITQAAGDAMERKFWGGGW